MLSFAFSRCAVTEVGTVLSSFETDERDYGPSNSGLACPSFREKAAELGLVNSTLAFCGFTEGVIQAIPVAGALTAELVTEMIENQVLPLLPCNSFLVTDNARVHDTAY